jgi:hypothetical protein
MSAFSEDRLSLPLTWEQVREMEKSGWVSYGAHTMHHPVLAYLIDRAEIAYEVTACRSILELQLGHSVRTFAYPIGPARHISEDVLKAVRLSGYSWACTTSYGINTCESNPYLLKRIEVDVDQHWLVVAAEAADLWGFLSRLRWKGFVRRHFTNGIVLKHVWKSFIVKYLFVGVHHYVLFSTKQAVISPVNCIFTFSVNKRQ